MRRFLRKSERIARQCGLTPQRYTLLLMIKGSPSGREQSTVTELAERLQLAQSTVTELVRRAEEAGLDRARAVAARRARRSSPADGGGRAAADAVVHRAREGARPARGRVLAPRRRADRLVDGAAARAFRRAVDPARDLVADRLGLRGVAFDEEPVADDRHRRARPASSRSSSTANASIETVPTARRGSPSTSTSVPVMSRRKPSA